jgi:MoaA/NifB/PqqE/SkfB family radical SAM enzyme
MVAMGEKIKLLKGLITGERAYVGPFYVCVNITNRCNLHCPACRFHYRKSNAKKENIPVKLFADICKQLRDMKTHTITITGQGEPLIHPHLPELIKHARDAGLRVTMTTNGTLLNESKVRTLVNLGLDHLKVSLWAGTLQEYTKSYPGVDPNCFNAIIDGLNILSRYKREQKSKQPYVVLHHPISSINYDKLDAIIDIARTTGCDKITFSPVRLWEDDMQPLALSWEQEQALCRSLIQTKRKLKAIALNHNIDEMLLRYKIGKKVEEKLPCYVAWLYARIHNDGKVFGCHNYRLPLGDLTQKTLRDIWNDNAYRTFRRTVLTRKGLSSLGDNCNCDYCGQTMENARVHRIFKWFAPFTN